MRLIKPSRKLLPKILSLALITFLLVAGAGAIAASAPAPCSAGPRLIPESSRYRERMTAAALAVARPAARPARTRGGASRSDEPGRRAAARPLTPSPAACYTSD
jgi:hypothetical protein